MSTFLQLCDLLTTRSGAIGTAPAAVTSQTGRQAKCVDWVMNAWVLIQNLHTGWSWLQTELSATALTISDMSYSASDLGISSRFGAWKGDRPHGDGIYRPWTIYDNSIGQTDESELTQISYERWRQAYDRGSHDAQRPICYAFAPDNSIRFGPKPDIAYRVRGEYRKSAQVLAANSDEPELPSRFHDIIVWRAIMLIAEHDEAPVPLQLAERKYSEMMMELQAECLPEIRLGRSSLA